MSRARPFALAAALAWAAALGILLIAGLPERAPHTALYFAPDARPIAPEIGAYAPPISAATLDGDPVEWEALRGAPVVINFWATWCAPCRVELPELQAVYADAPLGSLALLAVNLGERPEDVAAWRAALGLEFPLVIDSDGRIAAAYWLRGQPTTLVIDSDGVVAAVYHGPVDAATLRAALANLPLPAS